MEYSIQDSTGRDGIPEELGPVLLFDVGCKDQWFVFLIALTYSNLSIPEKAVAGEPVKVKVTVTNSGKVSGEEVVQLYLTDEKASTPRPIRDLEGYSRISLKPGESKVSKDISIRSAHRF
ncbi:MAG: fibronectin type III-like domain-contianing protein [Bacteroidia bacterium]|nr:fibronectin type III-like domain-contianing protein [Bacteroidia bacterium]